MKVYRLFRFSYIVYVKQSNKRTKNMATIETKTKITTCDACNATIEPEDLKQLKDDLKIPISYFMDQVNTIEVRLMELNIPYGKCTDFPDLCRNCTSKFLQRALERVTARIHNPVKAD